MVKVLVKELNDRFAIANALHFELDPHGMERAVIKTPQAEAIVYIQGAHITHYQPAGFEPVLFLSSKSKFVPSKAIRGGIPIIFPWFGPKNDDLSAPMHGYARTSPWVVNFAQPMGDSIQLGLTLDSPRHSNLLLSILIGARLSLELQVTNVSNGPMTFEEAFHTYLAVSDSRNSYIRGLKGATFIDKTEKMQRKTDHDRTLQLQKETDRVYINTDTTCEVLDIFGRRCITVEKKNSASTVVWNPWKEKAMTMPDLLSDDWQRMLCIETANVADNAITLAARQMHRMSATIRAESFDVVATLKELQQKGVQRRRAG